MKKYPFVKQEGYKECGIASILMLIKYYNGYISLNTLSLMTKTNKSGTTMYHLVSTLNDIGFSAEGVSCPFEELLKNKIPMPCICSVVINKLYNHFIVLYEINKKHVIIADPSVGIKKLSYIEFNKIYNNSLIIAIPNKTIPVCNEKKYYTIFNIIKKNIRVIKLITIYSIFITIFSIITSFYFGKLVDNINSLKQKLIIIFLFFFSICFIKHIMDYIRKKLCLYLNKKIDLSLTSDIFKKILSLPYKHYKNHPTGDIISRINDIYNIKNLIGNIIVSLFIDIPIIIVGGILLFKLNIDLFLLSMLILSLNIVLFIMFKKILYLLFLKLKNLRSIDESNMIDSINSFETVKGISIKKYVLKKVLTNHINYVNQNYKLSKIIIIRQTIKDIINNIGIIIINYIGILFVCDNKLLLGSLITFNSIFDFFKTSINNLVDFTIDYNDYKLSFSRINNIMINDIDSGFINYFSNGDIIIKNLNYSFDDISYVLKDINLKITIGEKLVVIGKSGSGKSTLFKLLKKYYLINFDKITIKDIDINNYKNDVINKNILYINQNEILFNDTIINNIKLDCSDDLLIINICKICEINSIVSKNSLGFNYMIEENGFNLSGGERQRIILARSLLRKFNILIIDEALNQVDVLMERRILKNIFNFYRDKTIIFISHRLNNCDLFNHIIEMKEGKIIKDESI